MLSKLYLQTVELLSGMNGYMVVYAIDDMSSFVYTKQVLTDLVEKASRDSVIALVGNKIDLERCREVSKECKFGIIVYSFFVFYYDY